MDRLAGLFKNNRAWARETTARNPKIFETLANQQSPQYLWIGCSDSRVPANDIVGLLPGELFVHRNVANVVFHTDLNCLSVIQYAVDVLQVKHIIVCGHYGCGGVTVALQNKELGLIDNWLRPIKDIYLRNELELATIEDQNAKIDRVCELNVIEQVAQVCHSTIVQRAWERGQALDVHGWIYGVRDGLLKDLMVTTSGGDQTASMYHLFPG